MVQGTQTWCSVKAKKGGEMQEERRFKREESYIHLWLIRGDVWKSQNYKVIILQLKIKFKKW